MVTLDLPHRPTAAESIRGIVTVGVLPANVQIVVRTADGKIVGTIAPYGIRPGQKAGEFMIPISNGDVVDGKVTLRLEVTEKGAKARVPTKSEVEDVKLTLIPTTPPEKQSH